MKQTCPALSDESLVPALVHEDHDICKIYFEVNHLGQRDRLVKIVAHCSSSNGFIIGLSFVYDSGVKRSVGYTFDPQPQSIEMVPKTQIDRFTVYTYARRMTRLEVCG